MNKKIVHLISSLKIGGAEAWLVDLLRNLPTDLEHHVLFFHDGPNRIPLEQAAIKTYHINGAFCMYDPLFLWRIHTTIKAIDPALIHSSLWSANFLGRLYARLAKIPLISSIHSQLRYNFDGPIRTFLDYISFGLANEIVPVSTTVAHSIKQKQFLIAPQQVILIKNGIDHTRLIQPTKRFSRMALKLDDDDFIIGAVGRFIPLKNFEWLIKQMAIIQHIPHAKLLLLGFGPQEQILRDVTKQLNLEKTVLFVIGQPATEYYPLMDCFVMPSEQEGLSIALLEAMSFGIPCLVANKTLDHDVIVHNKNGFLIRTDDNSLQKTLIDVINNENLRIHIGKNAQNTIIHEFSIQHMANAYYQLYKKYL